jgi:hypothetical protein
MNAKRKQVVAVILSAIVLSAPVALALTQSVVFTNLRGTLRVLQGVPCGGVVDVTTSIADGRMEITQVPDSRDTVPGTALFDLTRLEMFMTPFTAEHECLGVKGTVDFKEIGVRLASGVQFAAEAVGPRSGQYRFSIPKEKFLVFESVLSNLPVPQPETAYQRPSEDVTGVIDLRAQTAELRIVLTTSLHFRIGCVGRRCLIDEVRGGRQVADVSAAIVSPGTDRDADGVPDLADNCPLVANPRQEAILSPVLTPPADVTLTSCLANSIGTAEATDVCHARPVAISSNAPARFPIGRNLVTWSASDGINPAVTAQQAVRMDVDDRTAPAISCTADGSVRTFKVAAADDCDGQTAPKLGSFRLNNGEVIKIEETGKPGVRLINTVGAGKIRHFQVGKGEAVILATDAAGNTARAVCGAPVETSTRR